MKARLLFLGLAGSMLLLLFHLSGRGTAKPDAAYGPLEPVTLAIASDLHYLSPELTDHGPYFQRLIENADGKAMQYCEEVTDAFIEQVVALSPGALILSGDLTFNGARQSHEALAEKLRCVQDAGVPVFVLPGNHDLENPMAASFQGNSYKLVKSVTAQQFAEIYQAFGYQNALALDAGSLSYCAQLTPELWLLMVDVNTAEAPGIVTSGTLSWVEEQLAEARQKGVRVMAVSHQNLLQHNSVFSNSYVIGNSARLLELYERYDVICNLSGHMHIQHIAESAGGLPEIASGALMVSPFPYGILRLEDATGNYQTQGVNVSEETAAAAETFFWDTSYQQALTVLSNHVDAEAMAGYFADINAAYFSGRLDTAVYDTAQLYEWKEPPIFLSVYLQSIADDAGKNYTVFSFEF